MYLNLIAIQKIQSRRILNIFLMRLAGSYWKRGGFLVLKKSWNVWCNNLVTKL